MTLSAALIVRNEATEIAACLSALIGVEEIMICDTGSVDDTEARIDAWADDHPEVTLVRARFDWGDDFSAARNYAADQCTGDWILTVDADCRLEPCGPEGVQRLRAGLGGTSGRTCALWQVSRCGMSRNRRVLCHRPGVRWQGAIHEALQYDDGATLAPDGPDGCLIRYGYSASHAYDRGRNLRILRAEAERDPAPRTLYYLGSELWDRGELEEAEEWFTLCTERSPWHPERADAWLFLAKIRWQLQRGDEAREACLRCLTLTPDCREALELMAGMSWPAQADVWRRYASHARDSGVLFARSSVIGPDGGAE